MASLTHALQTAVQRKYGIPAQKIPRTMRESELTFKKKKEI